MTKPSFAIVQAAHDGITTHHCGVGTMVFEYFKSLEWISQHKNSPSTLRLFGVQPHYKNVSSYSPKISNSITSLCHATGGEVIDVGPRIHDRWPAITYWDCLSESLYQIIVDFSKRFDVVLLLAHDGPFSGAVFRDYPENVRVYWIPHSTSKTNGYDTKDNQFVQKEMSTITKIQNSKSKILCISPFMQMHLHQEYHVPQSLLHPFENGVSFFNFHFNTFNRSPQTIILSGRCAPYKNIITAIQAFERIGNKCPQALLLLNIIPDPVHLDYFSRVMSLVNQNDNIILTREFLSMKPRELYSQPSQSISLSTSVSEPFGLAPLEARSFGHSIGPIVLVPDSGGTGDQVSHGTDGFVYPQGQTFDTIANSLYHILSLSIDERIEIVRNARIRVIKQNWLIPKLDHLLKCSDIDLDATDIILKQKKELQRGISSPPHLTETSNA